MVMNSRLKKYIYGRAHGLIWCSRREQAEGELVDVDDSAETKHAECRQQIGSENSARAIDKFGSLQEEIITS